MRTLKKTLAVLGVGLVGALLIAVPAGAGNISAPVSSGPPQQTFVWPGDSNGNPVATVDITVGGFTPGATVFIEQCDGNAPTTPGWDPTQNCDNGTSPAGGIVGSNGTFTFSHTNPNFRFLPFKNQGPSGLFNCLSPNDPTLNNGLPNFRNCQLRVSTNNGASTTDQAFITLQLPDASAQTPEVPVAIVLPIAAVAIGAAFFMFRRRRGLAQA